MSELRTYYPPDACDVSYVERGRQRLSVTDRIAATRQRQHAQVADALAECATKISQFEEQLLEQGLSPRRVQDLKYKLLRQRAILASLERSRRTMIDEDEREKKQLREPPNLPEWVTRSL
jgi:hypothetical protein